MGALVLYLCVGYLMYKVLQKCINKLSGQILMHCSVGFLNVCKVQNVHNHFFEVHHLIDTCLKLSMR
jgi:hypothetical protein